MESEFDMVRYLKKIRIARSVAKISLSDFQRKLIPYFKDHVLSSSSQQVNLKLKTLNFNKKNTLAQKTEEELGRSMRSMLNQSHTSAIDAKILQSIGFLEGLHEL